MTLHQPVELAQDPQRLQYALFLGEQARRFSASALTIVQEARAGAGPYVATAAIIGESHFVCVRDRDARVIAVELLACADPETCGGRPTIQRGYADIAAARTIEASAGGVSVAARFTEHARRDTGWVVPPPARGDAALVLIHSFPGEAAPRTFVGLRIDRAGHAQETARWRFRISTVHEYVTGDRAVVITSETALTVPEELR